MELLRFLKKLNRKQPLAQGSAKLETSLSRSLSCIDVTTIGLCTMIGTGIYIVTGRVVRDVAGPGIILSYLLGGLASLLLSFTYAEMAELIPKCIAGYQSSYLILGEIWAFLIGWLECIQNLSGGVIVSKLLAEEFDSLLGYPVKNFTLCLNGGEWDFPFISSYPCILTLPILSFVCIIIALRNKSTAVINYIILGANVAVIVIIIVIASIYGNSENFEVFAPFGATGILEGAVICFYAFEGFSFIADISEEIKDPLTTPKAILSTTIIITPMYMIISASLIRLVPFNEVDVASPFGQAVTSIGFHNIGLGINVVIMLSMLSTIIVEFFCLTRTMFALSSHGLLPKTFSKVNSTTQAPVVSAVFACGLGIVLAIFFDISLMLKFLSLVVLLNHTTINLAVIIYKYRLTDLIIESEITEDEETNPQLKDIENFRYSEESTCLLNDENIKASSPRMNKNYKICGCYPEESTIVTIVVLALIFCLIISALIVSMVMNHHIPVWTTYYLLTSTLIGAIAAMIFIKTVPQRKSETTFQVPLMPFVPAVSTFLNFLLIFNLSLDVWMLFFIWILLGVLVYGVYSFHHSNLNLEVPEEEIPLQCKPLPVKD